MLCACGPVTPPAECHMVQLWPDPDGDGFGSGDSEPACLGEPGYAANDADCAPDDPRAHPGQTEWQSTAITGTKAVPLLWDFNCDKVESKRDIFVGLCGSTCNNIGTLPYWYDPFFGQPPACGAAGVWVVACGSTPSSACRRVDEPRVQACL